MTKDITDFKGGAREKKEFATECTQIIAPLDFDFYFEEIKYFDKRRNRPTSQITIEKSILTIDLGDGELIELDARLEKVIKEITDSKQILELQEDWDLSGAKAIKREIWLAAVKILAKYARYVLFEFSVIIQPPEINPVPNGTIDLSWRTKNARFLMNIKDQNTGIIASYYGDLYNNEQPIRDKLLNDSIIIHLAYWMRNLA